MNTQIRQSQATALMARSVALLFAVVAGATTASAATVIYTNEADFVAAVGLQPIILNEFTNSDDLGWLAHPIQANSNGISYYITSQPNLLQLVGFDGALSTTDTNYGIAVTFTSGNVTGVGGHFFAADSNGAPLSGVVTVSLSDGTVTNLVSPSGGPVPFVGFLTDGLPFSSLNISYVSGGGTPALAHFYVADGVPALSIALAARTNVLVSWYAAPTGFVLQAASRLQTTNWTTFSAKPQLVQTQFQMLVPISGPTEFFRLKKQQP
jgi:hypothetical protein